MEWQKHQVGFATGHACSTRVVLAGLAIAARRQPTNRSPRRAARGAPWANFPIDRHAGPGYGDIAATACSEICHVRVPTDTAANNSNSQTMQSRRRDLLLCHGVSVVQRLGSAALMSQSRIGIALYGQVTVAMMPAA